MLTFNISLFISFLIVMFARCVIIPPLIFLYTEDYYVYSFSFFFFCCSHPPHLSLILISLFIVHSPPQVKSPSVTIYPLSLLYLESTFSDSITTSSYVYLVCFFFPSFHFNFCSLYLMCV